MSPYLYGMHDAGGERHMLDAGRPGWLVITEAIGANAQDRSGREYGHLTRQGLGVIVRLNHGYGPTGTIPLPDAYAAFAQRCANYVQTSSGCTRWIVGNEPNHSQERPNGQPITAQQYAECFRGVQRAIKAVQPDAEVCCAAVAPWNVETGDWLGYFRAVLAACDPDAIALHAYTHGPDPALVTSEARMGEPYGERRWHFRAYRDFLAAVPTRLQGRSVYLTETNQGDGPWVDANTGWVQAAYGEIDRWNMTPGTQKIRCLCLYRWANHDQWTFWNKPGVLADFAEALRMGYVSPISTKPQTAQQGGGSSSYFPVVQAGGGADTPAPAPAREWDARLTARGVRVDEAQVQPGQTVWRLVKARWLDEAESQGRHHIYVDTLDGQGKRITGVPLVVTWPDGQHVVLSESKPGEPYAANFPMSPSRNEFGVRVDDGRPSDRVEGIGMGAMTPGGFNSAIHTSTALVFQRTQAAQTAPDPHAPTAPPTSAPTPSPTPPGPSTPLAAVLDPWVVAAILAVESGGAAFGADGRVIIRFEAHIFKGKLGNDALYAAHFTHNAERPWEGHAWRRHASSLWTPVHTGRQADEWEAYAFAATLHAEAAAQSLGMGSGQVMGFNHARIGYASAQAMLAGFGQSQAAQIVGAVNYILSDGDLVRAVNAKDWRTIALKYNGSGQVDYYAGLISAAHARLTKG